MGREADNSCRHCAEWLWLERTASGNDWEWVSFQGVDPKGVAVTSRFCNRKLFPEGTPRREHAPIPTKRKKLDRWLES